MTEEKAIERLKDLIHTCDAGIKEHGEYDDFFKEDKEAIKTVLNMLKEKDTEIQKKDKMIDLMAEYISDLDIDEDICKKQSDNNCDDINREVECKECIKQYFERKVEDERI